MTGCNSEPRTRDPGSAALVFSPDESKFRTELLHHPRR
jgi:hypothetical protein